MAQYDTVEKIDVDEEKQPSGLKGNTKNGRENIRSRAWAFTFNNYDKNDIQIIIDTLTQLNCEYIFQEETGKEGTRHLQGGIYFKNAVYAKFQDELSEKIHWEKGRNWKNLKKYCSKLDTRTGDVYTNISELKIIIIRDPISENEPYPWQKCIINYATNDIEKDREIVWIFDKNGGTGKTALIRHLCLKYYGIITIPGGRQSDIMYYVNNYYRGEEGREENQIRCIVINIPRNKGNDISYEAIEQLKDGMVCSPKYKSNVLFLPNYPKVIVLSNNQPIYGALTQDRWKVFTIVEKDLLIF